MSALAEDFPLQTEIEAGHPPGVVIDPVAVAFGLYPHIDRERTAEAGYEVYADVEFVKIKIPGDRLTEYFQPATEGHKRRFPNAYQAFKNRTQGIAGRTGLPLEQWAGVVRSQAMTLRGAGVHTVEELAAVNDNLIGRLGTNAIQLRESARVFLKTAADSAEQTRITKERDDLRAQLAAMQAQIDGMRSQGVTSNADDIRPPNAVGAGVAEDVVAAARRARPGSRS